MGKIRALIAAGIVALGINLLYPRELKYPEQELSPTEAERITGQKNIYKAVISPDKKNVAFITNEDKKYSSKILDLQNKKTTDFGKFTKPLDYFIWKDNQTFIERVRFYGFHCGITYNPTNDDMSLRLPFGFYASGYFALMAVLAFWPTVFFGTYSLGSKIGLSRVYKAVYDNTIIMGAGTFAAAGKVFQSLEDTLMLHPELVQRNPKIFYEVTKYTIPFAIIAGLTAAATCSIRGRGKEKSLTESVKSTRTLLSIIADLFKGKLNPEKVKEFNERQEETYRKELYVAEAYLAQNQTEAALESCKRALDKWNQNEKPSLLRIICDSALKWLSNHMFADYEKEKRKRVSLHEIEEGLFKDSLYETIVGFKELFNRQSFRKLPPVTQAEFHGLVIYLSRTAQLKDKPENLDHIIQRELIAVTRLVAEEGQELTPIGTSKAATIGGTKILPSVIVVRRGNEEATKKFWLQHAFVYETITNKNLVPIPTKSYPYKGEHITAVLYLPAPTIEESKIRGEEVGTFVERAVLTFASLHQRMAPGAYRAEGKTIEIPQLDYEKNLVNRAIEKEGKPRLGHNKRFEKFTAAWKDFIERRISKEVLVLSHGDAYWTNALTNGALIDFEKLCIAPPMYDLSHFLLHPEGPAPEKFVEQYCEKTGFDSTQFTPNGVYNSLCLTGAMLAQQKTKLARIYFEQLQKLCFQIGEYDLGGETLAYIKEGKHEILYT